jgi:hypothetical protein
LAMSSWMLQLQNWMFCLCLYELLACRFTWHFDLEDPANSGICGNLIWISCANLFLQMQHHYVWDSMSFQLLDRRLPQMQPNYILVTAEVLVLVCIVAIFLAYAHAKL